MTLFRSMGAALETDGVTGTVPLDVRKDLAGLFVRPGVLPGAPAALVTGTGGFAYSVGAAGFVTSRGASDGYHLWGNDGAVSVSVATWPLAVAGQTLVAPGEGLKRIDIIYALHPSNSENADTTSAPDVGVAKGQAQSSPIAPTLPTGALELGRNTMDSTATSTASSGNTIAQTFPWTAVKGSPVPVRNVAERAALTALASATSPVMVVRSDATASRRLEVCDDGVNWRTVAQAQTPVRSVRAADVTRSIGAWADASEVVPFPFVKDSWYLINGSGSVSTGGASALVQHRILAAAVDVSTQFPLTATPGVVYSIGAHLLLQAAVTVTANVSHQVYVPSPATGIVVHAGHTLSIVKVG